MSLKGTISFLFICLLPGMREEIKKKRRFNAPYVIERRRRGGRRQKKEQQIQTADVSFLRK